MGPALVPLDNAPTLNSVPTVISAHPTGRYMTTEYGTGSDGVLLVRSVRMSTYSS